MCPMSHRERVQCLEIPSSQWRQILGGQGVGDPEALETRLQAYLHAVIWVAPTGKEGPKPCGSLERLADVRGREETEKLGLMQGWVS